MNPATQIEKQPASISTSSSDREDVSVLIERATCLSAQITASAEQAERDRKMSDEIVAHISDAGIYKMLVPKRFGGDERSVKDYVDVMLNLSPLDTSAGWTTCFYITHNWMWCLLPEQAQEEIFANGPSALGPVMVAPTVNAVPFEDGYKITGRARWGTGAAHAEWCMVSGILESIDGGPPDVRMFAMPWSEVSIEDTWKTSGMAATASHDVLFDDVFVPAHRTLETAKTRIGEAPGSKLHSNPLYRIPFTPFLCLTAAIPLVAVARGISTYAIERAKEFVSTYSGQTSVDNPALQIRIAKADLMSRTAETLLRELASEIDEASLNTPVAIDRRVLMRAKASHIANMCRDVARLLAEGSGASAHMRNSPIQRAFRDISMAACHVVFDQDPTMELYGKVLFGKPPAFILA